MKARFAYLLLALILALFGLAMSSCRTNHFAGVGKKVEPRIEPRYLHTQTDL